MSEEVTLPEQEVWAVQEDNRAGVMTTDHHCVDHNVPSPVPGARCGQVEADTCAAIHRSGWQMRGWRETQGPVGAQRRFHEGVTREPCLKPHPASLPAATLEVQFDLEAAVRLKGAGQGSLGCILADQLGDLGKIRCPHYVSLCSCEMWQLLA